MKNRIFFSILALLLFCQNAAHAVKIRDAVYKPPNAGKVVFSHADHIKQKEMANNCRACHDSIFDLKKKKKYSMAEMERGKSCGACHNGDKAFSLKECASCHKTRDITYKVQATGPIRFSHTSHLSKSADCRTCHPSLFATGKNKPVTMKAMEKGRSCGACHNSRQAFSVKECSKCHPTKELVFEDKTLGNVLFSHTFHSNVYSCADCHTVLFKTTRSKARVSMQEMEKGRSCGACHNGKSAFSVKATCDACHTS